MKLSIIIPVILVQATISNGLLAGTDLTLNAVQKILSLNPITYFKEKSPLIVNKNSFEFQNWVFNQENISIQGIISNVGGISEHLDPNEVSRGSVVASPSKDLPNYFFQWVRDSALTIRTLVHYLEDNTTAKEIRSIIESYIENNYHLQRLPNRLGGFDDDSKSGLGEPKFLTNSTQFEDDWGRPQNDGPGLRVSTIIAYLDLIEKQHLPLSNKFLRNEEFIYKEIIKPDLIYIIKNWPNPNFDLWEEVNSIHFFTLLSQLKALKDGIKIMDRYEQESEFKNLLYLTFDNLKRYIEVDGGFCVPSSNYILETPSLVSEGKRCGIDAAVLLASLHSHDLDVDEYSDIPFDIDNSYILNTINGMVSDMRLRYPVNHGRVSKDRPIGVALGRYPEDIYNGVDTSEGNPWFITTASAAEVIFKTIYKLLNRKKDIIISKDNRDFFKFLVDFDIDKLEEITVSYGSPSYNKIMLNLFQYSDSFLEVIKYHSDSEGHMSEQLNRYSGFMQGAKRLTWSYSAVWNSLRWRRKSLDLLDALH